VEFNENNQGIEKFKKKMMSYLRCVARHYVPIDILDWCEVSKEMKNNIWDDIFVSTFRII